MKNLLVKEKPKIYQEVQNIDEYIESWITKAKKWKAMGIPLDVVLNQVKLEFDAMRLGINSHYHQGIQDNTFAQEEDQEQIEDIRSRYEHFVSSEKLTLPEKLFVKTDKISARLDKLKSQLEEQKKYLPENKQENNGPEETI